MAMAIHAGVYNTQNYSRMIKMRGSAGRVQKGSTTSARDASSRPVILCDD